MNKPRLRLIRRAIVLLYLAFIACNRRPTEYEWIKVTAAANWPPGYSFSALAFRDNLWIFGHSEGSWSSSDGKQWARFSAPTNLTSGFNSFVEFQDEVYGIGGVRDRFKFGEKGVWKTADGVHWTTVTQSPEWSARVWHASVAFADRLWVLGGYDGQYKNDVWSLPDGARWTRVTASAPWAARCTHLALVFDNRMWVIGGRSNSEKWFENDFSDVWYSRDGISWTRATPSAEWGWRYGEAGTVWHNRLWVLGGSKLTRQNDVWSSADGSHWIKAGRGLWTERAGSAATVFEGKLWLMGGKTWRGQFWNDVWYMRSAGEQFTAHSNERW